MHEVVASEAITHFPLRRLLYLQGLFATAFSILLGVVITVQFGFGLAKFGGLEYAPRALALSVVRSLGGGVSVAASLYALLVWTHRLDPSAVRPHLLQAAPSAIGLVLLTTPIAIGLALASGYLTSHWAYGVPWNLILASRSILTGSDVAAAGLILAETLVLTSALTWFALPFMCSRRWPLVRKLGATYATLLALRWLSELFA